MENISDNLRDFSESPYDVEAWGKKTEFTLTLSVVLKLQGNNEIINKIEVLRDEKFSQLNQPNWYYSDNPYKTNGIYRYPGKDLHFSLINFLKYSVNCDFSVFERGFSNFRSYIQERDGYEETINNIKAELQISLPRKIEADLQYIETGDNCRLFNSFSLQVFPPLDFIGELERIKEKFEKKRKDIFRVKDGVDIKLKAYPNQIKSRFSINILRFICDKEQITEDIKVKTKNIVGELNRKHANEILGKIKISKLSLVESDPFLFNKKPRIREFDI